MSNKPSRAQRQLTPQERWEYIERRVKNNDNLKTLDILISKELNIQKLDPITKKNLTQYVTKLGMRTYFNYNKLSEINKDIVTNFIKSLKKAPADVVEEELGTMEEELNRQIIHGDRAGIFNANTNKPYLEVFESKPTHNSGQIFNMSPYDYSYALRQGYTVEESKALLDSRYRNRSNDLYTNTYNWGYSSYDYSNRIGTFSTDKELSNIIAIRLGKFRIPHVANADNIYDRISVLFDNLPNSAIGREGRRYHFMCSTDKTNPNFIELTPLENEFKFNSTIKEIASLSVSFASPLQRFSFGEDTFTATAADLNPAEFTATNHGLQSNNLAFLLDYTTTSPATDIAKINEVNSDFGHSVTYIDDNTFSIQVDCSGVTASGITNVYNGNKRFWIPLTFVHLKTEDYQDN